MFTVNEASAKPLLDWHNSFVVSGNNGENQEKSGYLEFLSPNKKDVLLRLDFKNLGIFRVSSVTPLNNADIMKTKAELYCERIEMQYQPAAQ